MRIEFPAFLYARVLALEKNSSGAQTRDEGGGGGRYEALNYNISTFLYTFADTRHQRQRAVVRKKRLLAGRERGHVQGHENRRHPGRGRGRGRQRRGHVFGDKRLGKRRVQRGPAHGSFLPNRQTGLRGGKWSYALFGFRA